MIDSPLCNNVVPVMTLILPLNALMFFNAFAYTVNEDGLLTTALIIVQSTLMTCLLPLSVMMSYDCVDKAGHGTWLTVAGIFTLAWVSIYIYYLVYARSDSNERKMKNDKNDDDDDDENK